MTSPTRPVSEHLAGLRSKVAATLASLRQAVTAADELGLRCSDADMVEVWELRGHVKDAIRDLEQIQGLPQPTEEK